MFILVALAVSSKLMILMLMFSSPPELCLPYKTETVSFSHHLAPPSTRVRIPTLGTSFNTRVNGFQPKASPFPSSFKVIHTDLYKFVTLNASGTAKLEQGSFKPLQCSLWVAGKLKCRSSIVGLSPF